MGIICNLELDVKCYMYNYVIVYMYCGNKYLYIKMVFLEILNFY